MEWASKVWRSRNHNFFFIWEILFRDFLNFEFTYTLREV
jgi:hypothetical protein